MYNGTGFFVYKKNRLFLITASHVLTGWNGMQLIGNIDYPDKMEVILKRTDNDQIEPFCIDLRLFKKNNKESSICDNPDIEIIELDTSLKRIYKINSIEKYLRNNTFNEKDTMAVVGFKNIYPPKTHLREIINAVCVRGILQLINPNYCEKKVTFEVQTIRGTITQGFSGAPVFSIAKNGKILQFNGVCIGGEPGNKEYPKLVIILPNIINELIEQKLSQISSPNLGIPSDLKKWMDFFS